MKQVHSIKVVVHEKLENEKTYISDFYLLNTGNNIIKKAGDIRLENQ